MSEKTYKYFSPNRPIQIGGVPKNDDLIRMVNFEQPTQCVAVGKEVYGFVEYKKPLEEKDCRQYELVKDYDSYHRVQQPFIKNMLSVPALERSEQDDERAETEIGFYTEAFCKLGETLQRVDSPYYLLVQSDFQKDGQLKTGYAVIGHDDPYDLYDAVLNDDFMACKNGIDLAYDIHKNCFTSIAYGTMGVQTIDGEKFPYVNTIQNDVYVLEGGLIKPRTEKLVSRITAENGFAEVSEAIFERLKTEASDLHAPVAFMVKEMNETLSKDKEIIDKD